MNRANSRGVALLSVLLVAGVISALAYHLVTRHAMSISLAHQHIGALNARELAMAGERIARGILIADHEDELMSARDYLGEKWSEQTELSIGDAKVTFRIQDLTAKINLNAIVGDQPQPSIEAFEAIRGSLRLDSQVIPLWHDWIDKDQITRPGGAEDYEWLIQSPSRRTPDQIAAHISELQILAPAITEVLDELRELAIVLPTSEFVLNINTIDANLLQILNPDVDSREISHALRQRTSFATVADAIEAMPFLNQWQDHLRTRSNHFEVQIVAFKDGLRVDLTSRIFRDPASGGLTVHQRNFGNYHAWYGTDSDSIRSSPG